MRRSPDHVSVSRSLAIALLEMAKLFSNLITLLMLFVGVNAGGGDKDRKNESDEKTEVDWILQCVDIC